MSHSRQKMRPLPMCSLHDVFGGHDHVNGNYLPRPPHVVEVEQNNSQKGKKNHVALYVQPNVRLLLWTDPDLHTKYNRFLPPTTSSDAKLIMMMSFMQSFRSDVSSLHSELQGSVSSLVDKALSSRHLASPNCCVLQTDNSIGAASPGWRDGSSTLPVGHSTLSWCG